MFEDYRKYILGIRNNLIQCGVAFPVVSCESYRDIYELACGIDSILWYYSVLEISGSEDALPDFFLPLGNYYMEGLRRVLYNEFRDYVKEYDKLSVESAIRKKHLEELKNFKKISKNYCNCNEDLVELSSIGIEEFVGEGFIEHGRYLDSEEEEKEEEEDADFDTNTEFVEHGRYLEEEVKSTDFNTNNEFVEHGRYLEEEVKSTDNTEFVEHGRYLDSEEEEECTDSDTDTEFVEHGRYLEEEEDDSFDEEDDWDGNDIEYTDEDEDDSFDEDEEDDWDGAEYTDEDTEEEEDYYDEEEDDWDGTEYEEDSSEQLNSSSNPVGTKGSLPSTQTNSLNKQNQLKGTKDISDHLQDGTNAFLTSVKRAVVKGMRKLEK